MGVSTYPNGFADGITIRGLPINIAYPGKVFWLNNGVNVPTGGSTTPADGIIGNDSNPGTYQRPFATLAGALANSRISAGRGDIIMVSACHAETIATSSALALNVNNVAIVGALNYGDLRPTFTFATATSAEIIVSAANMAFINCILVCNKASQVTMLNVQAAGFSCDLLTKDTSATVGCLSALTATAAANDLNIRLRHQGFATSTLGTAYIKLVGVVNAQVYVDYYGYAATAVVDMLTTACKNIEVTGIFNNAVGALSYNVVDTASSTWSVNGFDANSGQAFQGSNNTAVAYYPVAVTNNLSTLVNAADISLLKAAANLPQTAAGTIFTVAGGPILIREIYGIVTTAIQNQSCTLQFEVIDTASSTTTTISGAGSITNAAVGTIISITGTLANNAVVTAGGTAIAQASAVLAPAGVIKVVTSASNTGQVAWGIRYSPLASGVTVS